MQPDFALPCFLKAMFLAGGPSMALAAMLPARGQITRIPFPPAIARKYRISEGVWVGKTLYLSGALSPSLDTPTPGNTETQTAGALGAIKNTLKKQKLAMGDIVMMHAYLMGDPANGGKMDFDGFMAGYAGFFGTKTQPDLPARSTYQVVALAEPTALVEIEVIAVKARSK
jgi:enamine deaminase RidA (YjgF/YER057c/UK114 family)